MTNLQGRQEKIQAKRKQTPWREFVKEICSWQPMLLHKNMGLISRYPQSSRVGTIMLAKEFFSQQDKLFFLEGNTGGFFENMANLLENISLSNLITSTENENCDYADTVIKCSNAYLSFVTIHQCDNVMYSFIVYDDTHDVLNSVLIGHNASVVYYSCGVTNSTKVFFSNFIQDSYDIWFSENLIGCQNCLYCSDLQNQQYCIRNQQYTKEQFFKEKQKILTDKKIFEKEYEQLSKQGLNRLSHNVSGNYIFKSQNIENGYYISGGIQEGRNLLFMGGSGKETNFYDCFDCSTGIGDEANYFAVQGCGTGSYHIYCSSQIESSSFIFYSYYLQNCSYCLGCIGLKNKSFCIFNKQYTKKERHNKVNKIFGGMEKEGTLGNFFPASMNPFYFNDTAASLIEDFNKEEIVADGYLWRDEEIKVDIPEWMEVVKTDELGNYEGFDKQGNRTIDPTILKKVIKDEEGNVYRVIKMEYDFLMKHGLPLPRKHRLERLKGHFRIK